MSITTLSIVFSAGVFLGFVFSTLICYKRPRLWVYYINFLRLTASNRSELFEFEDFLEPKDFIEFEEPDDEAERAMFDNFGYPDDPRENKPQRPQPSLDSYKSKGTEKANSVPQRKNRL